MKCHGLSRRQAEVAELVARGLGDKRIAAELGISVYTVRNHIERVASFCPGEATRRHRITLFFIQLEAEDAA